jgi:LacI family transcriptional regulator
VVWSRKRFRKEREIAGIRELARRSGVSVATVSRVLNHYPDVSDDTRERVLAAAAELDYMPTAAARTLVTKRSYVVGVVLYTGHEHPDIQHPFFQEVLVGLKHSVGARKYDLLLFSTEDGENGFGNRAYLKRSRHHHVDGVVLMGVDARDPAVRELAGSRIPCVAVDLDLVGPRTGYVMSDNPRGAELAVEHLYRLGHRRVAHVTGLMTTKPAADRLLGYRSACERLGLPYRDHYVQEGDFYVESGYAAAEALLDAPEPPTAVFAASDLMAVGAMQAAHDRGLAVPGDLAVVGFDDIQIAPLLRPALTTVRQDKARLGSAAGDALVQMIEDTAFTPPVVTLPVELVVRDSTGPAPRADADEALEKEVSGGTGAAPHVERRNRFRRRQGDA